MRLLGLAINSEPTSEMFTHKIFDSIRAEYSRQSWIEMIEELSVKYNKVELEGFQELLSGYKSRFTIDEIMNHCKNIKSLYDNLGQLLERNKFGDILNSLYRVGIIGNDGKPQRFSFKGDQKLIIQQPMIIHNALHNYLSIEKEYN